VSPAFTAFAQIAISSGSDNLAVSRDARGAQMQADSLVVVALMLGLLSMFTLGLWAHLEDQTRAEIAQAKGPLLAGAGAAAGVLLLLIAI